MAVEKSNRSKKMKVGFNALQDSEGNLSSKRLFGALVLIIGLIGHAYLGMYSIFAQAVDPSTATAAFTTMMITGGGLLGIGVLERKNK